MAGRLPPRGSSSANSMTHLAACSEYEDTSREMTKRSSMLLACKAASIVLGIAELVQMSHILGCVHFTSKSLDSSASIQYAVVHTQMTRTQNH